MLACPGRAAMASDASTAGANPAGMTRLDRSQVLVAFQGLYTDIQFNSEVKLGFKDVASASNVGPVLLGALYLNGLAGSKVDIDMTVPQAVMLSGYHQVNERWAIMGNIGWQDWSAFGKQEIGLDSTNSNSFTKDLDYDDAWLSICLTGNPRWV